MSDTVSLQEVLEEDRELEKIANAVLGDSDDSQCTYSQGYIRRQALYACATCSGPHPAGVCLACSLHCHEGHDLYELYTKRRFCCDCGNKKFPNDFQCKLKSGKDPENKDNVYNHNFSGLYCSCNRPYPDNENEGVDDTMTQCIVCEDWYHSRHLGASPLDEDLFEEMVCGTCAARLPFLEAYAIHLEPSGVVKREDSEREVSVEDVHSEGEACLYLRWKTMQHCCTTHSAALYFAENWRTAICRCPQCLERYSETNSDFLLDEEDTLVAYEQRGAAKGPVPDTHDAGMVALMTTLDHTQQIEMIHGYTTMKQDLVEFLKGFSQKNEVVTEKDVNNFFEGLKARKRQRLETGDGVPPSYCHQ